MSASICAPRRPRLRWLSGPVPTWSIGLAYADPEGARLPIAPRRAFDIVVYVAEVSATEPLVSWGALNATARTVEPGVHRQMSAARYPSPVTTARQLHHSYEEYLRTLELSAIKLEYCDGEIYAMPGGTPAHADLAAAAIRLLGNALGSDCRVSSSDLKVRVEEADLSTFPDATVVCGERRVAAIDQNAVVNPTVLVEVTSKSTEEYDRGQKLQHYQLLPSLRAVLIVSHRRRALTVVARTGSGFETREVTSGDVVLEQPGLRLSIDELYAGIELDEE